MNITLTVEQADALLEYLMTRPAGESINAIIWLESAKREAEAQAEAELETATDTE